MHPKFLSIAVFSALAIAAADYATGYELHFDLLYLVPVWLLARPGHRRAAVIMAILVTALWAVVDIASRPIYQNWYARYWNIGELLAAAVTLALVVPPLRALARPSLTTQASIDLNDSAAYARAVMRRIEPSGNARTKRADTSL